MLRIAVCDDERELAASLDLAQVLDGLKLAHEIHVCLEAHDQKIIITATITQNRRLV